MSQPTVWIVGAGAAGILAAWRAASLGARVILLEKTVRVGTKILVSGGGKCNLTHDGPLEEVLRAFRPNEARFLRPSFYRFTNADFIDLVVGRGLKVYTRPDGRIFPVHQTAKDVVQILRDLLNELGVEVRYDSGVERIEKSESGFLLWVRGEPIEVQHVVVSVGGSSFPNSGTTGDGWPWMKALGHTLVPLRAALAPMYLSVEEPLPSGVALRDVGVHVRQAGKEHQRWRADLLFTHQGVSGPAALAVSRVVAERMLEGPVSLEIDLKPDQTHETLTAEWVGLAQSHPHRTVANQWETTLPDRVVERFLSSVGISQELRLKDLDKRTRNKMVDAAKRWSLGQVRAVPLEKGEVVAGGVALDEVDPHTMESQVVPGMFLCGEILDVAGPVGGYNLQAAWSTGFVAGESAFRAAVSGVE